MSGDILTAAEVADAFRIDVQTVRLWVKQGRVTPLRVGDGPKARMLFKPEHVRQLEKTMERAAPVQTRRRRRRA